MLIINLYMMLFFLYVMAIFYHMRIKLKYMMMSFHNMVYNCII